MHIGNIYFASLICSASSFHQSSSLKRFGLIQTQLHSAAGEGGGGDDDMSALFGAKVPGVPDKPPPAPPIDEENPMGGQMFKKMMERAEQAKKQGSVNQHNTPPQPPQQPQQYEQQYGAAQQYGTPPPPPTQQQPPTMDPYTAYQAQLQAWQQQMASFAQFSASNPEQAAEMTMPPPPPLPSVPAPEVSVPAPEQQVTPPQSQTKSTGTSSADSGEAASLNPYDFLPKGDGRNKQAYEVNNAADVYFAQLKRDSAVRKKARMEGDLDIANKPFADVGVKALANLLSDELMESRRETLKRTGGEFETSRDEMLMPAHFASDEEDVDKSYTGNSYKQRLMEAQKKKLGGKNTPSNSAEVIAPSPKVEPFTLASTANDAPQATSTSSSSTDSTPESAENGESQPNFALPVKDIKDIEKIAAPSMEDSDETRKSIRTLMGLLLKHRGGTGFGHGRLKDAEGKKLEDMTAEVLALLNKESGGADTTTVNANAAPADVGVQQQTSLDPLSSTVACVDAVLNMYKTSDSPGKSELVLPLRDALLSAVNTINKAVVESEVSKQSSPASPGPKPVYASTMDFPESYQVTQSEEDEMKDLQEIADAIANKETTSTSKNMERLQKAYDTLKAITGTKKFGLKEVNSEEISNARGAVADMREVLMEELDTGISS